MRIRFLTSVAGANFAYRVKKEYDLRVDIARDFIKSGQAVAVEPPVEAAVMAAPEQATSARQKKRGLFGRGGIAAGTDGGRGGGLNLG